MRFIESEIALCVYDISNKKSFLVMSKWVKELQDNGPENMSNVFNYVSVGCSRK